MRITRIYYARPLTPGMICNLDTVASNHILRVLRLRPGAKLTLFNGEGGEYTAEIIAAEKQQAKVKIIQFSPIERESSLSIHLGQGISRGEKMDYTLQKAVELGVNKITPLFTEHSNVKLAEERLEKRIAHWQAIVISACEQCGRNRIPKVLPAESLSQWVIKRKEKIKLLLHPEAAKHLADFATISDEICLLVGAEGGFSENEIFQAQQAGFTALQLGPRILRTETAALAAIAALQTRWGDL